MENFMRFIRLLCALAILTSLAAHPAMADNPTTTPPAPSVPTGDFAGKLRLTLPPIIYAVPGGECNVYFDNVALALNPANYAFDVTCKKGAQQVERWTFTPTDKDLGDHAFTLEIRNEANRIIGRASATVRVSVADAGKGQAVSVLLAGDSLTNASAYSKQLLDLCKKKGNPALTLIGTHGPGGKLKPDGTGGQNRHEGYGGWRAKHFATKFTGTPRKGHYKQRATPFMYPGPDGKPRLDFAAYCKEQNGGKGPDVVTIFVGCNDTFSASDGDIDKRINEMLTHYDTLVKMVHTAYPKTVIGAFLPVPPVGTQDGFGKNYRSGQTRWQYKRNAHRVVERMIAKYGNREKENIFLVPVNVNLDCMSNYPVKTVAKNAHSRKKVARQNNGVHPAREGYRQIGDSLYAWLKARMAERKN
jgi:lysophospholipase L1-like esterase